MGWRRSAPRSALPPPRVHSAHTIQTTHRVCTCVRVWTGTKPHKSHKPGEKRNWRVALSPDVDSPLTLTLFLPFPAPPPLPPTVFNHEVRCAHAPCPPAHADASAWAPGAADPAAPHQKPRTRRPSLALAARASPHAASAPCHALAPIVRVCGAAMRGGRPEAGAGLPAQTHADAEPPIAGGTFCFPSAPRTHPSLPLSLPSKTRGLGAGRKLKNHRRSQLWADKNYKKSHLGSEWRKPFAGASHAKGIVLEKM